MRLTTQTITLSITKMRKILFQCADLFVETEDATGASLSERTATTDGTSIYEEGVGARGLSDTMPIADFRETEPDTISTPRE